MRKPDYDKLPNPDTAETLRMYIEEGYSPGGFMTAVLSNDLFQAVAVADPYHLSMIPNLVVWIYNEAPRECWGSKAKVEAWSDKFWGDHDDKLHAEIEKRA